ncbi:MAG: hypothetical protein QOH20_1134, partial [Mycobacterium sp.]|nr:hypothetical protein [Mycobacterium sp.]
ASNRPTKERPTKTLCGPRWEESPAGPHSRVSGSPPIQLVERPR